MADLTNVQDGQLVKIVGSDSAGVETYPVGSTPLGHLHMVPVISSKMKHEYAASPGSSNSTSTYTTVYSYSGTGLFFGFTIDCSSDATNLKLTIDGNDILAGNFSFSDIAASFALTSSLPVAGGNFLKRHDTGDVDFYMPFPIQFTSSVTISIKRSSAGTTTVNKIWTSIVKD